MFRTKLSRFIPLLFISFSNAFAYNGQAGATYEVPVPQQWKAYARFAVPAPTILTQNGKTIIHYALPAEIVGPKFAGITMVSDDYGNDHFKFESDNAKAECQMSKVAVCNIKFKNLSIDQDEVREYLRLHSKTQTEFTQRLQVAAFFREDPAGILRYDNIDSKK